MTSPNSEPPPHTKRELFDPTLSQRSITRPSGSKSLPRSRWTRWSSVRIVSFSSSRESARPTPITDPRPSRRLNWGDPVCCCVLWPTRRATPSTCSPTTAPTSCWTPWLLSDTGRCCVWARPGERRTVYISLMITDRLPCCLKGSVHYSVYTTLIIPVDAEWQWKGKTGVFYSVAQHCVAQSLERERKKKAFAMCFIEQNPLGNDIVCLQCWVAITCEAEPIG